MRRRPASPQTADQSASSAPLASLTAIMPMRRRSAKSNRRASSALGEALAVRVAAVRREAEMADLADRRSERDERNAEQPRRDARDRPRDALPRAAQRRVEAVFGDEARHRGAQAAVFPDAEIDPFEAGERGVFDRAVVEPVLELVGEQRIPLFAIERLDRAGEYRFHGGCRSQSIAAAIAGSDTRTGFASAMRRKKPVERSISSPRCRSTVTM